MVSKKMLKVMATILFVLIVLILTYFGFIYFGIIKTKDYVNLITLNQTEISLKKGKNYQLIADVYPVGIAYGQIIYESSNPEIVIVNSVTGYITAKSDGMAIVTARIGDDLKSTCVVNVGNIDKAIEKITITNDKINLMSGDNYQLKYKILPSNATIHNLYYQSSDNSIVKVDESGKITAIKSGKSIITVFSNNSSASDSVVVEVYDSNQKDNNESEVEVKSVNIKNEIVNLEVSGSIILDTEILPKNSNQLLNWTSSDANIAKVDKNGKVVALKKGEVYIIATSINGKTDKVKVVVQEKNVSVKSISIISDDLSLKVGDTKKLQYKISPDNSTNQGVTWLSSDPSIITVDEYGTLKAVKFGKALVKVISNDGNYTDSITITVSNVSQIIKETSITLSHNELNLSVGKSKNISYEIYPTNATYKDILWKSSNDDVATVEEGMIVAKSVGKATIIVTSHFGKKDTLIVTVSPIKVTGVSLTPKSVSIKQGDTFSLTPNIYPFDATEKTYKWSSSDNNVATINEYGIIKGVGIGTATITITTTDGNYKDTCLVTVTSNKIDVSSINMNITNYTLNVGEKVTLTATVSPNNATNKNIVWSSSNSNIITVNNGVVSAIGSGAAYVYATAVSNSNIKASCMIKVSEKISAPASTSANLRNGYTLSGEYNSDTLKFWIEKGIVNGSTMYVAHIWAKDAYNQLKTALSSNYGKGFETSATMFQNEISNKKLTNKGVVAINASGGVTPTYSYWLYAGANGVPGIKEWKYTSVSPIVIHDGKVLRNFTDRVMPEPLYSVSGLKKDGYIYQYNWSKGSDITYNSKVANQIINDGVKYTWGFVGFLVKDGKINVSSNDNAYATRSAIGQIDKNNFVLVCGGNFTLYSLANYLKNDYKCTQAINLDGGGSSSLSYKIKGTSTINKLRKSDRPVSDILYFREQ